MKVVAPGPPVVAIVHQDQGWVDDVARLLQAPPVRAQTIGCTDALDALTRLAGRRLDLLLAEMEMPSISGVELMARLRARGRQVPCVLITAPEMRHIVPDDGVSFALEQPTEPHEVCRVAGAALGRIA